MLHILQKIKEFILILRNSKYLSLVAILLLVAIIPLTVIVSQMTQDTRQRAAENMSQNVALKGKAMVASKKTRLMQYDINNDGFITMLELASSLWPNKSGRSSPTPSVNKTNTTDLSSFGYIVEFKKDPTLKVVAFPTNKKDPAIPRLQSQALDYQRSLVADHESAKKDILKRLNKKALATGKPTSSDSVEMMGEYIKTFNGIALNITEDEVKKIQGSPFIKKIYPNGVIYADLDQSVPLIKASEVWNLKDSNGDNATGKNVTIAVIDTGIDYTHPDLGSCNSAQIVAKTCPKVVDSYNFVTCDEMEGGICFVPRAEGVDALDDEGHGSHVAATAAGNGSLKGAAPEAKLIAYKVINKQGRGLDSWVMSGIEKSVDPNGDSNFSDHWDIISMSLGGPGTPDDPDSLAVDNAVSVGVTVVVAAGNAGSAQATIASPGVARKALTVGASNKQDGLAFFSSRGPVPLRFGASDYQQIKPDIVAPGVDICAAKASADTSSETCKDSQHMDLSGTSMATPHISGVVALLKQLHPNWTPGEIKGAITTTAKDLRENILDQGLGRVDALQAAQANTLVTPSSLSFGYMTVASSGQVVSKILTVKNVGSSDSSYTLSLKQTIPSGISLSLSEPSFSLSANESKQVTVSLNISNTLLQDTYTNEIRILSSNDSSTYRIPLMFFNKNMQIVTSPPKTNLNAKVKVLTPMFALTKTPNLVAKSPSGKEIAVPLHQSGNRFFPNPFGWESDVAQFSEVGAYTFSATTSESSDYKATGSLEVERTAPSFNIKAAVDSKTNSVGIDITPSEEISSAFMPAFIDEPVKERDFNWFPSMYAEKNNVYVVYNHSDDDAITLNFVKSTDFGNTWSKPLLIATFPSYWVFEVSSITKFKDKIYVLYDGGKGFTLVSSSDEGITWSTPLVINNDHSNFDTGSFAIKSNEEKLAVVYLGGNYSWDGFYIKYTESRDGTNWSSPKELASTPKETMFFRGVDLDISTSIKIVYTNSDQVSLLTSSDGVDWDNKKVFEVPEKAFNVGYISMISSGNNIFIVWDASFGTGLFFAKSTDNGNSWTIKENITAAKQLEIIPRIVYSANKLYLSWLRNIFGGTYLKISSDMGDTWGNEVALDDGSTFVSAAAASDPYAYFAWPNGFGTSRIMFTSSQALSAKVTYNNSQQEYINTVWGDNLWSGKAIYRGSGEYKVEVVGKDVAGNTGKSTTSFTIGANNQTFNFQKGWNLIGLAVNNKGSDYKAADLLKDLNDLSDQSFEPSEKFTEIARWVYGGYEGHVLSYLFNNFSLSIGHGYAIKAERPLSVTLNGGAVVSPKTVKFGYGWNLISFPSVPTSINTAEKLLQAIKGQGINAVGVFGVVDGSNWESFKYNSSTGRYEGNDFGINPGEGYFIGVSTNPGTFNLPETTTGPAYPAIVSLKALSSLSTPSVSTPTPTPTPTKAPQIKVSFRTSSGSPISQKFCAACFNANGGYVKSYTCYTGSDVTIPKPEVCSKDTYNPTVGIDTKRSDIVNGNISGVTANPTTSFRSLYNNAYLGWTDGSKWTSGERTLNIIVNPRPTPTPYRRATPTPIRR